MPHPNLLPPAASTPWPAPHPVQVHANPSAVVFLPYASGSMSVRRVVEQLVAGQLSFHFPDIERWHGREMPSHYPIAACGNVYVFTDAGHMARSIGASGLEAGQLKYVICLRDPRDMLVSLYFLSLSTEHLELHSEFAVYDLLQQEMQEAQASTVDGYALARADWVGNMLDDLRGYLATVPPQQIKHLSYAALCHAFPHYLASLINALGATPSNETIHRLLMTEDIQRPKTLNTASLAHFPKASPCPGRHKRDLQPETIALLSQRLHDSLAWMAENDLPEYRTMYA